MDGRCMDNIFVERLWRSLKYENVYLHAYASIAEAKAGIGSWLTFSTRNAFIRRTATGCPGRSMKRNARGHRDDRLRRTVPLPPFPEQDRETGKGSPSPPCPPASATTRIWKLKR